jgi:S1-C subfamily serine protease
MEFEPVDPRPRRLSLPLRLLLVLPVVALAFYLGANWRERVIERSAAAPRTVADATLRQSELETIELFRRASPSVVFITTLSRRRMLFDPRVFEVPSGNGSGFVWDKQGHVVTNYHVVQGVTRGERVLIKLADQSEWEAELVGIAPEKDLAVLEIDAPADRLPEIPIGSSRDLQVGQTVFAIGNPFGLDRTLTTGVISALGREIESLARVPIRDVVQTDAAINPGNSGGPLLDSSGRLIGVNTQIYSTSGSSAGIGFAIPVDTVNWVVPDLVRYGRVARPRLGIEWHTAYNRYLQERGIEGVLVVGVVPGSGAERAGLRPLQETSRGRVELGDIVVAVDDEKVRSGDDLQLALERFEAGQQVRVRVLRDGKEVEIPVELDAPEFATRGR